MMKTKLFGFTGRCSSQIRRDGLDVVQNARDEVGVGYILKNYLRDEARPVGESYVAGPTRHQNFMPRTSLLSTANCSTVSAKQL
jgi:hypothetical protein